MPVFSTQPTGLRQLASEPFKNEKDLQTFFQDNLEALLGVRLVASEFSTGKKHGGRIDTLGLDEVGNPVIIEYKWDKSESIINQAVFYLDWLLDHRGDFALAVQKGLGTGEHISWSNPRLIVVAGAYSKFDLYAVSHFVANLELYRYRRYTDGVLVVENVVEPLDSAGRDAPAGKLKKPDDVPDYGLEFHLSKTLPELATAFRALREQILELDGVEERANQKSTISYRTTKSFAAVAFDKKAIRLQLKGGQTFEQDTGLVLQDIRSYQWGYPWMATLHTANEVNRSLELVHLAYEFEQ